MIRQQHLRGRFGGDTLVAGRYEIRSLIGQGGMAEVYAAYDRALGRTVALKVLKAGLADDRKAVARFRREARAVAALTHPNIVSIHDVVIEGQTPFMVMELLEGETLSEVIRRDAPLPVGRAITIAEATARALAFAHDAGIVHRDMKPGNVVVGPGDQPTVLDFGLARAMAWTPLTDARPVQATAAYAPPEQFQGASLDARSDIYSLGVVLYEMLAGVPPFRADTLAALAYQHVEQPPPPLRALRPGIPPDLEALVARCLAKSRDRRYRTAQDLADELRRFRRGNPIADAGRMSTPARTVRKVADPRTMELPPEATPVGRSTKRRRKRVLVGVLTVMAVVVATALGGLFLLTRASPPARAIRDAPRPPALFAPVSLQAEAGCDGFLKSAVALAWPASSTSTADGYVVYRATSPSGPFTRLRAVPGRGTTTFVDHHLNTGTTYFYKVRSTAGTRVSGAAAAVSADTPFLCLA